MTIRTIMVAASGGSASNGAIELACRWALRLRAHLEGFHVINDARAALAMAGGDMGVPAPGLFEQLTAEAEAFAAKTMAAFEVIVQQHNLPLRAAPDPAITEPAPSMCWRAETGYAPALVAARARFFDLVVLGRSERVVDEPYTRTIEETLESAGRPVLLAPAEPPAEIGRRIAIAWNGSPEAVRGVAAALPLLQQAESVAVMIIEDADTPDSLNALFEHLAWHGIKAAHARPERPVSGNTADALLAGASMVRADLLVMGSYSRKPWREALFSGATRDMLTVKAIPL